MDDRTFQTCLLETQVPLTVFSDCGHLISPQVTITKDYTKWNFETLQEIIDGPLLNPKRMEEAIRGSRFMRRLMSFFHPFSHQFSDIRRTRVYLSFFLGTLNHSEHLQGQCSLGAVRLFTPEHLDGKPRRRSISLIRRCLSRSNCEKFRAVGSGEFGPIILVLPLLTSPYSSSTVYPIRTPSSPKRGSRKP